MCTVTENFLYVSNDFITCNFKYESKIGSFTKQIITSWNIQKMIKLSNHHARLFYNVKGRKPLN